jgi:hypothetical protein
MKPPHTKPQAINKARALEVFVIISHRNKNKRDVTAPLGQKAYCTIFSA